MSSLHLNGLTRENAKGGPATVRRQSPEQTAPRKERHPQRPARIRRAGKCLSLLAASIAVPFVLLSVFAADRQISPDQPNTVAFTPQQAQFVRLAIHRSSGNQACIDELEVYGPSGKKNLALASAGAKAMASSCLVGYAAHQVAHLNDGRYGNDFSWIAASDGEEWAQVQLPEATEVARVVFSRDRMGQYGDRLPVHCEVLLSADGNQWKSVAKLSGEAGRASGRVRGSGSQSLGFMRQHAKSVRLYILGTNDGAPPSVDEVELYGLEPGLNVAAAEQGAQVRVSSAARGKASLLNDGEFGDAQCWTAARRNRQWVQIDFPKPTEVSSLVFSRDRGGLQAGGVPSVVEAQLSMDGNYWKTVAERGRPVVPSPPPAPTAGGPEVAAAGSLDAPRADELGFANLALGPDAKAAASSLLPGFPGRHEIAHLNDGHLGNGKSWISNGEPSWAEIDLGGTYWIYKVATGSDSSGQYTDRAATDFRVLTATQDAPDSEAKTWTTVARQGGSAPLHTRTEFRFKPVQARWVRVALDAANQSQCRLDEIEVYGQKDRLPLDKLGPLPDHPSGVPLRDYERQLRVAFLGEEYAWLKTYGRADMDPRLTEYVRVWEYPRHVGDDQLPLPPLPSAPKLDGQLDDACWQAASCGVVRVALPADFERSPLVDQVVHAGWLGDDLLLGFQFDRLLSGHLAVVSTDDWQGCGVIAWTKDGLVFNTYTTEDDGGGARLKVRETTPLKGALSDSFTVCEVRLPLSLFPHCREKGLRLGLGLGGRYTSEFGRPVGFMFSSLAVAEEAGSSGRAFRVRLSAAPKGQPVTLRGNVAGLDGDFTLAPGQSKVVEVPTERGPLGPQRNLTLNDDSGECYSLHLLRYDPLERPLTLMAELADRLEAKGLDVGTERKQLAQLLATQTQSLSAAPPDRAAEREASFQARLAKRRLLLRDPDLAPLERILCGKRHNFEPSHNYSVLLDSAGGPGGSVNLLEIPRRAGRLEPGEAIARKLFDAGTGIARNPMASFDLSRVYFGYCKTKGDYYHLYSMKPDGSALKRLTDGPFHDYWPCPLPDGGLAFITTRCKSRYLCWRPQAAVLFRMDAAGNNMRALSFANLTEWAPSVMDDGRLLWTRSEYQDKGADHGHMLWAIRPDGTCPELMYGNTLVQPNGFANGREVPGTDELCAIPISHFGDLNGPVVLIDRDKGPFDPAAITTLTPEVPWPGAPPVQECFREPVPLARDYLLCAHAPLDRRFQLYVVDRFGNRELLYGDPAISVLCPTPFQKRTLPPVLSDAVDRADAADGQGEFFLTDVYRGLEPYVKRGQVKWLRVCQEVRANLDRLPTGEYRNDHPEFMDWYATPVHKVSGPFGWTSYVAKASWGLVPVAEDGSARFTAPAGKVLYFEVLDEHFNELQRMRSVVQLQPGERRSCIGCHESRNDAPPTTAFPKSQSLVQRRVASWEGKSFSYEQDVQPVLDRNCVRCHDAKHPSGINLAGTLDADKVPASYRTLVSRGLAHYVDWGYKSSPEKLAPRTFGTVRSKLFKVLEAGHHEVTLTPDDLLRLKTWVDLNCPLWPDYMNRELRPGPAQQVAKAEGRR